MKRYLLAACLGACSCSTHSVVREEAESLPPAAPAATAIGLDPSFWPATYASKWEHLEPCGSGYRTASIISGVCGVGWSAPSDDECHIDGEWTEIGGAIHLRPSDPTRSERLLVPVQWGDRRYLVEDSRMSDFLAVVGRGQAQADIGRGFLLRDGDEDRPIEGAPSLPSPWDELLVSVPIESAIVAHMEPEWPDSGFPIVLQRERAWVPRLLLDAGSRRGVRTGQGFLRRTTRGIEVWRVTGVAEDASVAAASVDVLGLARSIDWRPPAVGECLSTRLP